MSKLNINLIHSKAKEINKKYQDDNTAIIELKKIIKDYLQFYTIDEIYSALHNPIMVFDEQSNQSTLNAQQRLELIIKRALSNK